MIQTDWNITHDIRKQFQSRRTNIDELDIVFLKSKPSAKSTFATSKDNLKHYRHPSLMKGMSTAPAASASRDGGNYSMRVEENQRQQQYAQHRQAKQEPRIHEKLSPPPLLYPTSDTASILSNASTISSTERSSLAALSPFSSFGNNNRRKELTSFDYLASSSMSARSLTIPSSWLCKQCSYKNSDLHQSICALCGLHNQLHQSEACQQNTAYVLEGMPSCFREGINDKSTEEKSMIHMPSHFLKNGEATEDSSLFWDADGNGTVRTGITTIQTNQSTVRISNLERATHKTTAVASAIEGRIKTREKKTSVNPVMAMMNTKTTELKENNSTATLNLNSTSFESAHVNLQQQVHQTEEIPPLLNRPGPERSSQSFRLQLPTNRSVRNINTSNSNNGRSVSPSYTVCSVDSPLRPVTRKKMVETTRATAANYLQSTVSQKNIRSTTKETTRAIAANHTILTRSSRAFTHPSPGPEIPSSSLPLQLATNRNNHRRSISPCATVRSLDSIPPFMNRKAAINTATSQTATKGRNPQQRMAEERPTKALGKVRMVPHDDPIDKPSHRSAQCNLAGPIKNLQESLSSRTNSGKSRPRYQLPSLRDGSNITRMACTYIPSPQEGDEILTSTQAEF